MCPSVEEIDAEVDTSCHQMPANILAAAGIALFHDSVNSATGPDEVDAPALPVILQHIK
jgi:hypothetical protein